MALRLIHSGTGKATEPRNTNFHTEHETLSILPTLVSASGHNNVNNNINNNVNNNVNNTANRTETAFLYTRKPAGVATTNTTADNGASHNTNNNNNNTVHDLHVATKALYAETKPWKNASQYSTVDKKTYKDLVRQARASAASMVGEVYTNCEMHILPPPLQQEQQQQPKTTAKTRETTHENPTGVVAALGNGKNEDTSEARDETKSGGGGGMPVIRFRCNGENLLREDLCHTVTLCRVVTDEKAWNISPTGDNDHKHDGNRDNPGSALLVIFDGLQYMNRPEIFRATLNKASYAYQSNRPMYAWIGNLREADLNRRENESMEAALGFRCAPKQAANSMHFYKPVAFLVLMDVLSGNNNENDTTPARTPSSQPLPKGNQHRRTHSFFFLDADADFTTTAFERIPPNDRRRKASGGDDTEKNKNNGGNAPPPDPMGPESYLELSPQASLMATQNEKGQMLMNSGVMIVRNTQWARDFAALWWHGRCGHKDQLVLWLVLYATFSAWTEHELPEEDDNKDERTPPPPPATTKPAATTTTTKPEEEKTGPAQFAYPGLIFFSYDAAMKKHFMIFRKEARNIQASWEALVKQKRAGQTAKHEKKRDGVVVSYDYDYDYDYPLPTNTKLYNGGPSGVLPRVFDRPLELPHVVILPQAVISYDGTEEGGGGSNSVPMLDLPRLKSDDPGSFVKHSKHLTSCSDGRCWPYLEQ